MKRKILFIAMCAPFPNAKHAGGKTFNFYIDSFANDPQNEITLITKILDDEIGNESKISKNIHSHFLYKPKGLKKYWSYLKSISSKFNPFYRYGNVVLKYSYDQYKKCLLGLKETGYEPDIVVLEWTSMLLYIDTVKRYYPNAVYVASEHDVTYLGLQRQYQTEQNYFKKKYKKAKYQNMKKRELLSIEKCDLVVTHNTKDLDLLISDGTTLSKISSIVPYYDKFEFQHKSNQRDILFYGAMNREENAEAAMWFINNVMPLLKDAPVRFVVIGNKPSQELQALANTQIVITGFVEDPSTYFKTGMCAVAPLLHGAGVKVKVIETLSAGLPVLTNKIGIEGIPAENGVDYILCKDAEDYAIVIKQMLQNYAPFELISQNAKEFIGKNYNLHDSFLKYSHKIYDIENKKGGDDLSDRKSSA